MESEILINSNQPSTSNRVLGAAGPVLWIAISYMDPGKWATAVEGGARLGFDIALLMLVINCAAIFWQYLSARIAIATGKDLAQICREEYDERIYLLLGIQAETSIFVLDLTTVLGNAYGLNAVFGIDLYSCVFLTSIDAVLFPFLASLFENPRAKLSFTCMASCILVSYVCGLVISQTETSVSIGGMFNKLSGENAYLLMAFLGANIMPHNFYLHSSIVQNGMLAYAILPFSPFLIFYRNNFPESIISLTGLSIIGQQALGKTSTSKGSLFQDHFFAIVCVFSGIFLGNIMLMNWAAHVFYSNGLVSLTLPDALSLLDQVSRSSIASLSLLLIMFFSNQLTSLQWSHGSQLILQDFFKLDIPCWLHRAAIRLVAITIALYCVWSSGLDSIFQLLIFTQVLVALLLPSSVFPLYQVASSERIMGVHIISHLLQFLASVSFIGMLVLKIVFLIEMIFGTGDWADSLSWNIGGSLPMLYYVLIITAFICLGFTACLAITPLKPEASGRDNTQEFPRNEHTSIVESPESNEVHYQQEQGVENQETELSLDESFRNHLNLPETFLDSERNLHLATIQENKHDFAFSKNDHDASPTIEAALPEFGEVIKGESLESEGVLEKTLKTEGDVQVAKEDDGDNWEPEESSKYVTENNNNLNYEGSGPFKSLSGKLDDVGSGTGSLSRLAGLGRAARRQLTATLDEFWGQLFDFHGQITQDAKAKKLDNLLGIDSKLDSKSLFAPVKMETLNNESSGNFYSPSTIGSDSFKTSNLYNSSMQQNGQSYIGSPMWSNQMQQLDACVQNSNQSGLDFSERRYSSMKHVPSSNDAYDYQPATIHGYDMASYLNRIAKENGSDNLKGQLESLTRISGKSNAIDPYSRFSGQTPQNGLRMTRPPGFHNVPVSRNVSLNSEKPVLELSTNEPVNVKKYYSLPDISGLKVPNRDSSLSGNKLDYSIGYGPSQSMNRQLREQTLSSASSWGGSGLGLNELSPSKVCRDAFSLQFGSSSGTSSLWSKQPYERFGVADKSPPKITATILDMEAKILQSLRICINKLLKLEGSDWLFRQNDGTDEDLIDRVAAREKFVCEVEMRTSGLKPDDVDHLKIMSVPNCGDACVWRVDLVISFGVWCIHRILELSLMESRPELWGKYTYVLNRLQGIIDPAFSKPRSSLTPCFCLLLPAGYQQKSSQPISNDGLPPNSKLGRGKFTTAPMLLEMIKDVELAISSKKGRSGTAAGDVAFPRGKENLASVLKRYKRRLSNKPVGTHEAGTGSRKNASSPPQSFVALV